MRAPLRVLYQFGMAGALLLIGPILLALRGGHYRAALAGRLGRALPQGEAGRGGLWIHAVSVGEVGVASTLARALPPELPLVVTTITPTGQERARAAFAERPATAVAYLPLDLALTLRPFFARFAPRALVLVEGDYWPLALAEARRRGLPIAVVNGRVGDRGYSRSRRVRPLARRLLARVDRFGVQTELDRDRLLELGVACERIEVTGNLKYDTADPALPRAAAAALERWADGRPILLAGSTMAGEEERVIAAWESAGGPERSLLAIAPRHPERWDEVAALLASRGLAFARRSRVDSTPLAQGLEEALAEASGDGRVDVALLDSLGELAGLYALARGAFVGGSFGTTGGHNPLEPARFAVPVAVGPDMHNFSDIAERFTRADAWHRVQDAAALGRVFTAWLDDPAGAAALGERGARLVETNRGALPRTAEFLAPILTPILAPSLAPSPPPRLESPETARG